MTHQIHGKQTRSETDRQKETCLCNREARNWGARLQKRVETMEQEMKEIRKEEKEIRKEQMLMSFFHHGEVKPMIVDKKASRWKKIVAWLRGEAIKWESGDKKEAMFNDDGKLVFRDKR
jgi:hypothetical protein